MSVAAENRSCLNCGQPLGGLAPSGLCSRCLLVAGLDSAHAPTVPAASGKGDTPDREGRAFGDYELLEELARGGMGVVYRARQVTLDRVVAVKLLLAGSLAGKDFIQRFRTEAAAAASLQHSNIVAIHEVGFAEGQHFFAMDYVEGPTLAQLVAQGPLPARRAAAYLKTIAEAIHFAHERGVLHRDLKPSNVLIDSHTDQPRVTDFGLAKKLEAETELTLSGQILGSPNYISPEQATAKRAAVGRRSDVYSLGAILYHLLTGRPPFQGETMTAVLHQVVNDEPLALRLINPSLPRDIETICLKCLEKDPGKRCQSALDLAEELGRFLRDEPIVSRPVSRTERSWRWCRRNPVMATLAGATVALLLAVAIGAVIAAVRIDRAHQRAQLHLYAADMNLAQGALAEHDLGRARGLLDRHRPREGEPDLRGFEWRYLWRLGQSDPYQALEPEVGGVRFVTFSRNGRWLAAGGERGSAVWEVASETKPVIETLPHGEQPLAFSPTQDVLLTVTSNAFRRWNTENWQPVQLFERDDASHETAAFSKDGRWLATQGSILRLWDTETWTVVSSNEFGPGTYWGANNLAFSPDGRTLCCSRGFPYAGQCEVRFFHVPTLEALASPIQLPRDTSSVVFTPDGHRLVTGDYSGRIRLWNSESGVELPCALGQSSRIMDMVFSPGDTNVLASTGGDRTIRLWDFAAQKELMALHGNVGGHMEALAFSPDGALLASGGWSQPIMLWNPLARKSAEILIPQSSRTVPLGFLPDGRQFITADVRGTVKFWDAQTAREIAARRFQADFTGSWTNDFSFIAPVVSTDLRWMAVGLTNGEVRLIDLVHRTNALLAAHASRVRALAFSIESGRLASVGEDSVLRLWEIRTLRELDAYEFDAHMDSETFGVSLAFSHDGRLIAAGSWDQIRVWNLRSRRELRRLDRLPLLGTLEFSPDGRQLVSGHVDYQFRVWNTSTWEGRPVSGHQEIVLGLSFTLDGRRLVSTIDKLLFWDTATWQEVARFPAPIQDVWPVLFSPDGNVLVASEPRGLRLWRAPSFAEIEAHEKQAGRWRWPAKPLLPRRRGPIPPGRRGTAGDDLARPVMLRQRVSRDCVGGTAFSRACVRLARRRISDR